MLAKTLIRNLTSPPTKPTLPCSSQLGGTINSSSDLCALYTYSFKVLCSIYAGEEKMSTIYQLISLCWTSQVIGVRSFTRFFPEQRSLSLGERVEKSITFQWRRKHFESGWANSKQETGKFQLQNFLYTWVFQKLGGPYTPTSYALVFVKSDRAVKSTFFAKLNILMIS